MVPAFLSGVFSSVRHRTFTLTTEDKDFLLLRYLELLRPTL